MTASWYEPVGRTPEARMQDILRRRERWLSETPTAADCIILVHPSDRDTIGWWMSQHGVEWAVLPRGGPHPGQIWLVSSDEVEDA